jgi:hypothetical protein
MSSLLNYLDYLDPNSEKCKLPRCKKAAGIYKVLLLVICFIFLYNIILYAICGDLRAVPSKDPWNRILFKIPVVDWNFSTWPLTHFLCFFVLGLLFPDEDLFVLGMGVLWEVFESTCFLCSGRTNHEKVKSTGEVEYVSWWNGSFQDIIYNTLGFYAGKLVAKATGKKFCFPWANEYTDRCGGCETQAPESPVNKNVETETNVEIPNEESTTVEITTETDMEPNNLSKETDV